MGAIVDALKTMGGANALGIVDSMGTAACWLGACDASSSRSARPDSVIVDSTFASPALGATGGATMAASGGALPITGAIWFAFSYNAIRRVDHGAEGVSGIADIAHFAARGWVCFSVDYRLSLRAT